LYPDPEAFDTSHTVSSPDGAGSLNAALIPNGHHGHHGNANGINTSILERSLLHDGPVTDVPLAPNAQRSSPVVPVGSLRSTASSRMAMPTAHMYRRSSPHGHDGGEHLILAGSPAL
jgi:hypothetical protein